MKNEYFDMVKNRLKKYNDLKAKEKIIMSRRLSAGDPYGNMGVDYSQVPAGSHVFNTSSRIENEIVKSDEWIREHSWVSKEIRELDMAMEPLKEIHRKVVVWKYIEGLDWEMTASKARYSQSQCKRFARGSLIRMADILYGEESYDLPIYNYIKGIN